MTNAMRIAMNGLGCSTAREFKKQKRAELKEVRRVFDVLRLGCAAMPLYPGPIDAINVALEQLTHACSAKEWGR